MGFLAFAWNDRAERAVWEARIEINVAGGDWKACNGRSPREERQCARDCAGTRELNPDF